MEGLNEYGSDSEEIEVESVGDEDEEVTTAIYEEDIVDPNQVQDDLAYIANIAMADNEALSKYNEENYEVESHMHIERKSSGDSDGDSQDENNSDDDDDDDDDDEEDVLANNAFRQKLKDLLTEEETENLPSGPPRTKHEVTDVDEVIEPLPEIPREKLMNKDIFQYIGDVLYKIDHERIIVVQAHVDNSQPLNEGSVLVGENGELLGQIFEIFGPVTQPFYLVKYKTPNSSEDTSTKANESENSTGGSSNNNESKCLYEHFSPGSKIFTVHEYAMYLTAENLRAMRVKGSDASNQYDEEPAPEEIEYSDDEQELLAKQARNRAKKSKKLSESNLPSDILAINNMLGKRKNTSSKQDVHSGSAQQVQQPYYNLNANSAAQYNTMMQNMYFNQQAAAMYHYAQAASIYGQQYPYNSAMPFPQQQPFFPPGYPYPYPYPPVPPFSAPSNNDTNTNSKSKK